MAEQQQDEELGGLDSPVGVTTGSPGGAGTKQ